SEGVSMSSRPSPVPAAGVAAFLAVLTGGATWLASGKPLVGLIGLIGALASGAALLILTAGPGRTGPTTAGVPAGDADRSTLVQLCIYLRDRLTSTALATRL